MGKFRNPLYLIKKGDLFAQICRIFDGHFYAQKSDFLTVTKETTDSQPGQN